MSINSGSQGGYSQVVPELHVYRMGCPSYWHREHVAGPAACAGHHLQCGRFQTTSSHLLSVTTGIHRGQLLRFEKPGLFLEYHRRLQRENIDVPGACILPRVSWAQTSLLSTGLLCPFLAQVLGTLDVTRPKRRCWHLLHMAPPLLGDRAPLSTQQHILAASWP